ncbi:hypothetical protein QQ045_023052 [Rhodiola kirilowii]
MRVMEEDDWKAPKAYHRICIRHFASNFNLKVKCMVKKALLTSIGYENQQVKFCNRFKELKELLKDNQDALKLLDKLNAEKWALSYDIGGRRWGSMTTNVSESFNHVLMVCCDLSITTIVHFTFKQVNAWFIERRDALLDHKKYFIPKIESKNNANLVKSTHCKLDISQWKEYVGPKHIPNKQFKRTKRGRHPTKRRRNEMDARRDPRPSNVEASSEQASNDSLIFLKAMASEVSELLNILSEYEKLSGQKVNFLKSEICFSKNANDDVRKAVKDLLIIKEVDCHSKYLGLPLVAGQKLSAVCGELVEKLWSKLQSWENLKLSVGGREILIKAVWQAIP